MGGVEGMTYVEQGVDSAFSVEVPDTDSFRSGLRRLGVTGGCRLVDFDMAREGSATYSCGFDLSASCNIRSRNGEQK